MKHRSGSGTGLEVPEPDFFFLVPLGCLEKKLERGKRCEGRGTPDLPPASLAELWVSTASSFPEATAGTQILPQCLQERPPLCDIFLLRRTGHGLKLITASGTLSAEGQGLFKALPQRPFG